MRDVFADIFREAPANPMEAARRNMRPPLRKRFYRTAQAGEGDDAGIPVLLDGKPVRTPARRALVTPVRELAEAIAAEWDAQETVVDPMTMPLTRLANAIIDGVLPSPQPVRAEIERFLAADLLLYRAGGPEGLAARQAAHWDPVLRWAEETLGARFVLAEGVMHVSQPTPAVAAAAAAIPGATSEASMLWRLGALNVVTTLTGSALLALALAAGSLTTEATWTAAHVDEDWNMEQWGRDTLALDRRAKHFAEMQAAATVLALVKA